MSNHLPNFSADIYAIIISKLSVSDLQCLRATNSEVRDYIDTKILMKIIDMMEHIRIQLLNDVKSYKSDVERKEKEYEDKIKTKVEELREEMKQEAIRYGEYIEGEEAEYEYYDDEGIEGLSLDWYIRKNNPRELYDVVLSDEKCKFSCKQLSKIEEMLKDSYSICNKIYRDEENGGQSKFAIVSYSKENKCERCDELCTGNTPYLTQKGKGIFDDAKTYCYRCICSKNKKEFLLNLLEPNKMSKLQTYALNYNVLRIMSGCGGLAYNN